MFAKTYYATHPDMMDGASNDDLRDRHLVTDLFTPGRIVLNYSHGERFIIGGAVPGRLRWRCRCRMSLPRPRAIPCWSGANWASSTLARRAW
jgi:hypothetical protein